jgi:hypothetical protein
LNTYLEPGSLLDGSVTAATHADTRQRRTYAENWRRASETSFDG